MPAFHETPFHEETVHTDGNKYTFCKFTNCEIIYSGGVPPEISNCEFSGNQWHFRGPASDTIRFMRAMYSGLGDWGRETVEDAFAFIREERS